MKIEIWSDFACPFCYIGKTRFEKALEKFEHKDKVEVVYKSFIIDPNAPKKTNKSSIEELAASKGIPVQTARAMYDNVVRMAKLEGLNYNLDDMQATSTIDAHKLLQWAKELHKGKELSEKLYEGYFILGLNLADHDTLLKIILDLGLDVVKAKEVLLSNEYQMGVDKDLKEASMLGITSVPTFVVDRAYGVSGAQKEDYFLELLENRYQELYPTKIKITQDDSACGPDGCDI